MTERAIVEAVAGVNVTLFDGRDTWEMKNLRTCFMTVEERISFDPVAFSAKLRAAGFTFVSDTCPIKLCRPFDQVDLCDGTILWRQWDVTLKVAP